MTTNQLLAAVPPEIAGLPTWALNGLSIGGLVMLILMGLFTSKLWTKRQVDELTKQHEREVTNLSKQHDREVTDLKERYEKHLTRTVELYQGRVDDARTRETEWRDVAGKWQAVADMLGQGIEPLQDQSETMLRLLQAWQSEASRRRELES
jgi:transposase